ncbi:Vinculin [Chionoecetes opilio]|uniref:Vinculin n=1 Tax=Chionoecetes opilio TaxID=41210 RepID=A0A8J4Y639_CHIOP|nr:Vinculin [Chionoecetes opilio]
MLFLKGSGVATEGHGGARDPHENPVPRHGTPGREQTFENKANNLANFSNRAAKTALMVAAGSSGSNKKLTEALLASAGQVESLTPQLVAAGRIRMTYPTNKAADEHFENLRRQYAESIQKVRDLADEATDSAAFIKASGKEVVASFTGT